MGDKKNKRRPAKKRQLRESHKHKMEVKRRKTMDSAIIDKPNESPNANSDPAAGSMLESRPKTMKLDNNAEENLANADPNIATGSILKRLEEKSTHDTGLCSLEAECDAEKLIVETALPPQKKPDVGRRIISVSYFYKRLQEISHHGPLGCALTDIELVGEKQDGLNSKFTFLCKLCNLIFIIDSDSNEDHYMPINNCAVAGIISIGGGHSHLQELSSALNIPLISNKKYQTIHEILAKNWQNVAQDTMNAAAEKERNFAITEGRVNKDGIPIIDVCVDGCYSKRSYKTKISDNTLGCVRYTLIKSCREFHSDVKVAALKDDFFFFCMGKGEHHEFPHTKVKNNL